MRIVIDLQGAQTESRFRGIGRYSLSLTKAIIRNRGDHEVLIVLNGLFPETIEPIRAEFDALLPQENIRVWHTPGPVQDCVPGNEWRREIAELVREAFLSSLKPDIIHISSLFEGYEDDAVTSLGVFDYSIPVSVSLYDLIPLINPEHYLKPYPAYERFYLRKIEQLRRASLLLSISEFSRREGLNSLGSDAPQVVNISTSVDDNFRRLQICKDTEVALRGKFGLTKSFVLYTGGADERKNLTRLIYAYARLSDELRNAHQLAIAGKFSDGRTNQLRHEAETAGLNPEELIFTGYVSEIDLVQLYNLCKLYVFPSWHEGFGLPALEAMACGAPVICSNTSSLPEVINNPNALFDPYSADAIQIKLEQALRDETFRSDLIDRGLEQAKMFSWNECGRRAIAAFKCCIQECMLTLPAEPQFISRPKLAYVSPLPPERSGIADYSAELLPELSRHYDIDVIVAQESVSEPWITANCQIRDVEWLRVHADNYDRVLYHFGNSSFHEHMFALLEDVPGTVVLHDFFLGNIQAYRDACGLAPGVWSQELYNAHGYTALWDRYHLKWDSVVMKYPANLSVLQRSQGVIVHSETSLRMATQWYDTLEVEDWSLIPLLRVPAPKAIQEEARRSLGLGVNDFIVCSFGFLNSTKLNRNLLAAWLNSTLANNKQCFLVFVGEINDENYGEELLATIRRSTSVKRICITGWVDMATFRKYLVAADVGVQLRTLSRGETSAAVLDCMNYGLPTIVNANGSMLDLPDDGVWKLPDEFSEDQMVEALETLWRDVPLRTKLGSRAREIIATRHAPDVCADQYFEAIERFNTQAQPRMSALVKSIAVIEGHSPNDTECLILAKHLAKNFPVSQPTKQLLVDVSATCRFDLKTGIQRVARALMLELIKSPPEGYRIEPVYFSDIGGHWHYRYARRYTLGMFDCPSDILVDEIIETRPGDIVLGLDLLSDVLGDASPYLDELRRDGVKINFIVFDLLPILLPHVFPHGTEVAHANWLHTISRCDGAICISKSVADELEAWIKLQGLVKPRPLKISWFHLGANIENSSPSRGMPDDANTILKQIQKHSSFFMVGTIEPRKGYAQALAAFEQLWAEGVDTNLIIVGNEGWKGIPNESRRTIPEIVERLRKHPEIGKRLFWLEGVSDEYLERVYAASTCLIAASEGEGFGLPLIEAAQHKLPIIARDIPVFREVAGDHAFYFNGLDPEILARSIKDWFALYKAGNAPTSAEMPWLTWAESAQQLLKVITND